MRKLNTQEASKIAGAGGSGSDTQVTAPEGNKTGGCTPDIVIFPGAGELKL